MPEIKRIELERDNDQGVHVVKEGERLEPVDPVPPEPVRLQPERHRESTADDTAPKTADKRRDGKHDVDEFERATTPFPGG